MCGFSFSIGEKPLDRQTIKELINSLEHRGPDDYGVQNIQSGNMYCTLVHTRLAILDTNCPFSRQPFESQKYWIAFNGEIYNHRELKNELMQKGNNFRTKCDTEVLGVLLDNYGEDGIKKLEGMWSFVAVKKDLSNWIASRDFFGEKPLFLAETITNEFLASTPKQIEIMMNSINYDKLKYNEEYLTRYLLHGHRGSLINENTTIFEDVKRVQANTTLIKKKSSPIQVVQTIKPLSPLTEAKKLDQHQAVHDELIQYIEKSFCADPSIKISCLLSGGLDSNLIASLWGQRKESAPLLALTLKGRDWRYDESEIVKQTILNSKYLKHEFIEINTEHSLNWTSDIINKNKDLLLSQTAITSAHIFNAASSFDSKVALTGTGGDEIFAGYLVHHLYYLGWLKNEDQDGYASEIKYWNEQQKPYIRNKELLVDPEEFIKKYPTGYWPDNQQEALFINEFKASEIQFSPNYSELANDTFRRSLFVDLFQGSNPASLVNTDYAAMHFGIENRAPLLSSKALRLLNQIDSKEFIKKGQTKSIMRKALGLHIPNHILNNKEKKGFNAGMQDLYNMKDVWDILDSARKINLVTDKIDINRLVDEGLSQDKKTIVNGVAKLAFRTMNMSILFN